MADERESLLHTIHDSVLMIARGHGANLADGVLDVHNESAWSLKVAGLQCQRITRRKRHVAIDIDSRSLVGAVQLTVGISYRAEAQNYS